MGLKTIYIQPSRRPPPPPPLPHSAAISPQCKSPTPSTLPLHRLARPPPATPASAPLPRPAAAPFGSLRRRLHRSSAPAPTSSRSTISWPVSLVLGPKLLRGLPQLVLLDFPVQDYNLILGEGNEGSYG